MSDDDVDKVVGASAPVIHFIGVGGAGMSALAKVFLESGYAVTGSDIKESRYTRLLRDLGARVTIGHRPEAVEAQNIVIVSSAIPVSNSELRRAAELGIPVAIRAQLLGWLTRQKRTVAVAGTHGKTTTTSLVVRVLHGSGFDPTFLVGGELNDIGSNAGTGLSDLAVVEADESDGSLLRLSPAIAVITNVDADHMDHYGTFAALEETFARWLARLPEDGLAVVWGDGSVAEKLALASGKRVLTYGFAAENDHSAREIGHDSFGSSFEWWHGEERLGTVRLSIPGRHNILNALAAGACCLELGVPVADILVNLAGFSGVKRRFQFVGEENGITVVDDYAHHPTEVLATLEAARQGDWGRVICVFQPHRFSRTEALAKQFGAAFDHADVVVVAEVYGAGEEPQPGVSGKLVPDAILRRLPGKNVAYIPRLTDIVDYLRDTVMPGDLVLTMGAGDVRVVGELFLGIDNQFPAVEPVSGR